MINIEIQNGKMNGIIMGFQMMMAVYVEIKSALGCEMEDIPMIQILGQGRKSNAITERKEIEHFDKIYVYS